MDARPLSPVGGPHRWLAILGGVPPVPRAIGIAGLICSAAALATHHGDWLRATPAAPAADSARAAPIHAPQAAASRARRACDTCGIVETIRRIEPVGERPGGYEFTVRLRDGSVRTSIDADPSTWRIGDRVMLIGGGLPRD